MNARLHDPTAETLHPFVSQASFRLPELMTFSTWHEHAPFAFWLADAVRPRTIVELGVHHGFSYFVLCQSVRQLMLDARCFAIDTWKGDEHAGTYGEDVYERVCRHNRRYDAFSRLIRSDFAEACDQFADGSIDLLHIDGCHTYEAVRRDFDTWLPKLSPRGVIMFHDIAEYGNGFGVHLLWDMLRQRYLHFEFHHGHGLGLIGVGDAIPERLGSLFGASGCAASAQAIRATYQRLGACIAYAWQIEEQRDRIAQQTRQIAAEQGQIARLTAAVALYEASTSWRVTAPLRKIAGYMHLARGIAGATARTLRSVSGGAEPDYGRQNLARLGRTPYRGVADIRSR